MKNQSIYAEKQLIVFSLILIVAFSFLLYFNTSTDNFLRKDLKIIAENPFIKDWQYLPQVFTKNYFSISGEMSYRPLVTISYFVDYAIWHLNPFGFHMTNVIFHVMNSVLLYLLLHAVLSNNKITLLAMLFFVTHPVLVEAVNSSGYRDDLMAATFVLVSFIFFIKSDSLFYREKNQATRGTFYYTISLASYLCALFSKEMAITLPVLLMVFMVFSHPKPWGAFTNKRMGMYAGYLAISLFYLIIRFMVFSNPAFKPSYQPGGFWTNALTMTKILASYIKLSFFPLHLNADYAVSLVKHPLEVSFMIAMTFLISIFVIFAVLCKTRNVFAVWMSWFFITLLPVMNIIPINNIMAERYLYIPVMGFCVAKGMLIYRITDRSLSPRAIPLRRIVQQVLIVLMIGGYSFAIIWKNGN